MKKLTAAALALLLCMGLIFSCAKDDKNKDAVNGEDTTAPADTVVPDDEYEITGPSIAQGFEYDYDDLSEYITLGEYRGISVDYDVITVTDDDVETAIKQVCFANGASESVSDRASAEGDTVTFDCVGVFTDSGAQFDSSTAKTITIGDSDYVAGFEENMIGIKVGESKTFALTFPADYSSADFAGKDVTFQVKVTAIAIVTPAPLTDDLVASFGIDSVTTVEQYRVNVREQLEKTAEQTTQNNLQNAIYDRIISEAQVVKYPEKEFSMYAEQYDNECVSYATAYSKTVEQYKIDTYGSVEAYEQTKKQGVENKVKTDLVIYAIARDYGIEIGDDEYEEALRYGYQSYGAQQGLKTLSEFESVFSASLTRGLMTVSVLEKLAAEAVIAE